MAPTAPSIAGAQPSLEWPPRVQPFELQLPPMAHPGSVFRLELDEALHEVVVPLGVQPGQHVLGLLVPPGASPGSEVVVQTSHGDMAVGIPEGMQQGEILIIDKGERTTLGDQNQSQGSDQDGGCIIS